MDFNSGIVVRFSRNDMVLCIVPSAMFRFELWSSSLYSTRPRKYVHQYLTKEARVLQSPWVRAWTFECKKLLVWNFDFFHCFIIDFILSSFLLTHMDIVILVNKKGFMHRDFLFLFMSHKAVYCCHK